MERETNKQKTVRCQYWWYTCTESRYTRRNLSLSCHVKVVSHLFSFFFLKDLVSFGNVLGIYCGASVELIVELSIQVQHLLLVESVVLLLLLVVLLLLLILPIVLEMQ